MPKAVEPPGPPPRTRSLPAACPHVASLRPSPSLNPSPGPSTPDPQDQRAATRAQGKARRRPGILRRPHPPLHPRGQDSEHADGLRRPRDPSCRPGDPCVSPSVARPPSVLGIPRRFQSPKCPMSKSDPTDLPGTGQGLGRPWLCSTFRGRCRVRLGLHSGRPTHRTRRRTQKRRLRRLGFHRHFRPAATTPSRKGTDRWAPMRAEVGRTHPLSHLGICVHLRQARGLLRQKSCYQERLHS
jgi:hypothetical protein